MKKRCGENVIESGRHFWTNRMNVTYRFHKHVLLIFSLKRQMLLRAHTNISNTTCRKQKASLLKSPPSLKRKMAPTSAQLPCRLPHLLNASSQVCDSLLDISQSHALSPVAVKRVCHQVGRHLPPAGRPPQVLPSSDPPIAKE